MEVLHTILTIVQVILAVGLVVIVTVQSGKSAGLSAAIGGGDGFAARLWMPSLQRPPSGSALCS